MSERSEELLAVLGEEQLAAGAWEEARDAFAGALEDRDVPELHDGLGRALWWLRDVDGAIAEREQAYVGFRRRGDLDRASRIALWLAREFAEAVGNEPASRGWLARASGLIEGLPAGSSAPGWLAATRGRLADPPASAVGDAQAALDVARDAVDADLEATALALLGLALVDGGRVDAGIERLDEAMVVATAGEVTDLEVFGDICCLATRGVEEIGDATRLMRWNEVVMSFMQRTGHPGLLEFCGTCCAEVLVANGNLAEAEGWLARALRELEGTGHRARCVHPAAKLAELRLLQGRVEEAERLLAGFEERADALRAAAAVHLAKGETAVAASLLLRRLNRVGDAAQAVPLLSLLVQVQIAHGDLDGAAEGAGRLGAIADRTDLPRHKALAALALGRVARARGDAEARADLEDAVEAFVRLEMPLEAAAARLELASALAPSDPATAANEARLAREAAEQAGATRLADEAAAALRRLGGPARTGPKGLGLLTKREREVLSLLGEGLTNAEIAARLFISTKTAEHHVSNILAKLHLRSRSEAAAFAVRHAAEGPDAVSARA